MYNALRSCNAWSADRRASCSSTALCTIVDGDGSTVMELQREQNERQMEAGRSRVRLQVKVEVEVRVEVELEVTVAIMAIQLCCLQGCVGRGDRSGPDNLVGADALTSTWVASAELGLFTGIKINLKWFHMV